MSSFIQTLNVFGTSDFSKSTWLILGATLQCILVGALPRNISVIPPLALLLYRFIKSYLIANGSLPNPAEDGITYGRQTWQVPSADGAVEQRGSKESIVVLVLAASWTHPNGRFSPGSEQVGVYFNAMWREAQENREKYGFLGNTPALGTEDDGSRPDSKGSQQMFISYWKTLEGLHKFAHGDHHMKGQLWWERTASKQFKHLGIMHEVYEVPAGNWENVYHNFRPFGICKFNEISKQIEESRANNRYQPVRSIPYSDQQMRVLRRMSEKYSG